MSVVSFAVFCGIQVVTDTTVTHSSVNLLSKPSRPSQDDHHHWDVSRSGRSCVSYSETMANIQTHDVSQDLNVIREQECVVDQIELHSWLMKLIVLHLQLLSLWRSYCSFFNVTFYSRFILQMSRVKFSVTSLRWCVNFQWTVTQTDWLWHETVQRFTSEGLNTKVTFRMLMGSWDHSGLRLEPAASSHNSQCLCRKETFPLITDRRAVPPQAFQKPTISLR